MSIVMLWGQVTTIGIVQLGFSTCAGERDKDSKKLVAGGSTSYE